MSPVFYSLRSIHNILKKQKASSVYIVTSTNLAKKLSWAIHEIGVSRSHIITIPSGENAKGWDELEKLLRKFNRLNLDRSSVIIALGGGSVGDVVGFAASIYLRGIKYIQVPTTLLAQVDSAHGGKTGINFLGHKNQVGSFSLPLAVIIDTRFIQSLPVEQTISGLGEILKAGFIKDPAILSLLKNEKVSTFSSSKKLLTIIKKSVEVKRFFVTKDSKDNGLRQILNVGHTFGHAIELKYGISHGKAVIAGMLQEIAFTERRGISDPQVRVRLLELLDSLSIKVDPEMEIDWSALKRDKKITRKKIAFPTIENVGVSKLLSLELETLKRTLS